jgi:hypothetical protein
MTHGQMIHEIDKADGGTRLTFSADDLRKLRRLDIATAESHGFQRRFGEANGDRRGAMPIREA